jgi:PAS domain S-box-containing protein
VPIIFRLLSAHRFILFASFSAFLLTLVTPLAVQAPFALYIAAVAACALHGGIRPGLLATALSAGLLAAQESLLVAGGVEPADPRFLTRLALFAMVGLLASYLSRECLRAIEAARRFHDVLGHVGDAILITDRNGHVTFLNPAAETITGWKGADALGRPLETVFQPVHEADRAALENPAAHALRDATSVSNPGPTLIINRKGIDVPVEYWAEPLEDKGGLRGALVVVRDITRRRRAEIDLRQREDQFRALAGAAPVALLMLDPSGRCVYSNAGFHELSGLAFEETLGEGWSDCLHPEDRGAVAEWLAAVQAAKPFARHLRVQDADGNTRWLHLHAQPARSTDGHLQGAVAAFLDVSHERDLENDLAEHKRLTETLRQHIADRDRHIQEKDRLVQEKHRQLHEKHQHVEARDRQLQEKDRLIQEHGRHVQERDRKLQELEQEMNQRAADHADATAQLKDHQEALRRSLEERAQLRQAGADTSAEAAATQDRLRRQLRFATTLTASLADGVYAIDRGGRLTYMNPAAERLLGFTEAELLGRDVHALVHVARDGDDAQPAPDHAFLDTLSPHTAVHSDNVLFRRKDGTTISVACTIAPLLQDDQVQGAVFVLRPRPQPPTAHAPHAPAIPEPHEHWLAPAPGYLEPSLAAWDADTANGYEYVVAPPPSDHASDLLAGESTNSDEHAPKKRHDWLSFN